MSENTISRRLVAILTADVVGYSRMVGEDEEGTITRLNTVRVELLEPAVARYNGRIVKTMGDGFLVEYLSAIDAVRNAVDLQRRLAERNANLPDDQCMEFRIGINLGDVIVEGDDILGDSVNIAARLEEIAVPGGVCISDKVGVEVAGKVDVTFRDQGEYEVKNIAQPVRVLNWHPDDGVMPPVTNVAADGREDDEPETGTRHLSRSAVIILVIIVLIVAGISVYTVNRSLVEPEETAQQAEPEIVEEQTKNIEEEPINTEEVTDNTGEDTENIEDDAKGRDR